MNWLTRMAIPGLFLYFFAACTNPDSNVLESDTRPNIILIVADDHGKDGLGCYGNPIIQTPNLDALAATGIRFNRAFCTTASCSASRSVILSGLYNHANGQYGHAHAYHHFTSFPDIKTLPVRMAEGGYRTAHIGKYHVAPDTVYHFQQRLKENARSSVMMAEKCRDLITQDAAKPFFLYFCFSDPHRGGGFAKELPYQPDRFGNQLEGYSQVSEVQYDLEKVIVPSFLPNTPDTRAEIAQYYQSISRLDQGVGRLVDILQESGKFENSMILYISDNGMAFPGAKTTLYEAGMQLPCIVKLPNQKESQENDALINWTDLAPTILDVADIPFSDSAFHGKTFLPAMTGGHFERSEVFASHTFHEITMYYPMRVVRGERYKLIMNLAHGLEYPFASDLYASKTWQSVINQNLSKLGEQDVTNYRFRPRFELFDLENDPYESNNLAGDPQYGPVLESMQGKIKKYQEDTGDPWVYKWIYE